MRRRGFLARLAAAVGLGAVSTRIDPSPSVSLRNVGLRGLVDDGTLHANVWGTSGPVMSKRLFRRALGLPCECDELPAKLRGIILCGFCAYRELQAQIRDTRAYQIGRGWLPHSGGSA